MIRWITENLGTAAYEEVTQQSNIHIVDVRDMVDKTGNLANVARQKLEEALSHLNQGEKVIVCCDYGMSRSNAIAAGVLSCSAHLSFNDAVRQVMLATGEKGIKIEVLSAVRDAIEEGLDTDVNNNMGSKKRILVTGGSGFIGSALIPHLRERYDVFAPKHKEIDLIKGTVNLDLLVKEQKIECIVHLANPHVYSTNEAIGETLVMLKNVLDVCRENEIKLIYPSSWEVYSGYRSMFLLASETLPKLPKGPYGESKYLCEILIEHHQCQYGLDCAILRSSPVYGVGGDKPKFIYNFLKKAINNEEILAHKYINGHPSLDLLYIDDLISAFLAVIESDYTGSINIGSGKSISTTEVAEFIVKSIGSTSPIEHHEIQDFAPNIVMDISIARSILNWKPKISIQDGIHCILNNFV